MKEREPQDRAEAAPHERDDARAAGLPRRERRSAHRVADDQGSGHGAQTALAKLKMIERRRRLVGGSPGGEADANPSAG
ncbi:hypothetical protein [Ramlibacter sp. PS4R-6]|uniref:hypothetical protein n=1 Tax=Ramlibacter sp. PS4R-6 TaxID=3133438 RepID=UPI00309E1C64